MARSVVPSKNPNMYVTSAHQGFPHYHREKGTCMCLSSCCTGPSGCRCRGCSGIGHTGCPAAITRKAAVRKEAQRRIKAEQEDAE